MSRGEPKAAIVVAHDCVPLVNVAARDFQHYIREMSGATLPIQKADGGSRSDLNSLVANGSAVLIGLSRYTQELGLTTKGLGPDGFRIVTRRNLLAIVGRDTCIDDPTRESTGKSVGSAGTFHGVCRVLGTLGVRWFYPGRVGEVVPRRPSIVIRDLNLEDAPYFSRRAAYYTVKGDNIWNWRIGFGPGEVAFGSCHPFTIWPLKYKESHPGCFAVSKGSHDSRHVCFSHPNARERMLQDVRNFFRAQPYATLFPYFTLLFNDGCIRSCECERCRALVVDSEGWSGSDSDLITDTATELAAAIEAEHPSRGILLGAYNKCIRPPTRIKRLPQNIAVIICKHGRLHQWSEDYRRNVRYVIEGWRKLKPREVYFWEYYGHRPGAVMFCPHFIQNDVRYLRDCSESGPKIMGEKIFTFGPNPRAEQGRTWWFGLNCYVTAKLLWDPNTDIDALLEDYYTSFYGPAAATMKELFQTAERVWSSRDHGLKWEYGDSRVDAQIRDRTWSPKATMLVDDPMSHLWTPEILAGMSATLARATRLAEVSPYRERVDFVKQGFAYTRSACEKGREQAVLKKQARKSGRRLRLQMAQHAPQVDGEIDSLWQVTGTEVQFTGNQSGSQLTYGTRARLMYSSNALHVMFECNRVAGSPLLARHRKRDGAVWDDECVELFVDPAPDTRGSYYHVIVNSNAAIYDASTEAGVRWDSGVQTAVTVGPDSWQLEATIPFAALGGAPKPGAAWSLGLFRSRHHDGQVEQQAGFPNFSGRYHVPEMFGRIVFSTDRQGG